MTEFLDLSAAGSSRSATFGKQQESVRRRLSEIRATLKVPDEISELLRKSVGWNTIVDRTNAKIRYLCISRGAEYSDLNIEDELKKLKGLSSALGSKYDIHKKECEEVELKYEDAVPQLVEELVKKVPDIKVMPGYEHLTSTSEKFQIEKALRKKVPEVKLQDEDALAKHLKNFRTQRLPMEIKLGEVHGRLRKIDRLRRDVDDFIQILTAAKQSRLDNSVVSDVKRKKPESPTKNREKLGVRKEVEDGLFKVRREVGGPRLKHSAIDNTIDEFKKKWDNIVDDFINLLTEANAVVSEVVVGDKKRKKPENQTKISKKLGDKKIKFPECPTKNRKKLEEVEDGLLEMLKEIGGPILKSSVVDNDEFRMKLLNIGDAFTKFLDYYFC